MKKLVTTYFLNMSDISKFKPKAGFKERMEVREISGTVFQQWSLFVGVGMPWKWYSRLKWSPREWQNHFSEGKAKTYLAFAGNKLAGYYELLFQEDKNVEIKFIGLFPEFIGSGYGALLLSHAVCSAWETGASGVWLHTCTSDHEAALGNYLARGFELSSSSEEEEEIPDREEYLKLTTRFMEDYYNHQFNADV